MSLRAARLIGDQLEVGRGDPAGITARFVAFCLVIAGAALMPAPMRATPDAPSS